jgi:VanZ family protein
MNAMANVKSFFGRWGPSVLMMSLIYAASSIPGQQMPQVGSWDVLLKKGGHMFGYALLCLGFLRGQGQGGRRAISFALAGCVLFALSDEWHQSFVIGRNSTLVDVGIDAMGSMVGAAGFWQISRIRKIVLGR